MTTSARPDDRGEPRRPPRTLRTTRVVGVAVQDRVVEVEDESASYAGGVIRICQRGRSLRWTIVASNRAVPG